MLVLIWLVVLVAAGYLYFKEAYSRYTNTDVKCPAVVPLVGSNARVLMRKEHLVDIMMDLYNKFADERFYGLYEFLRPMVVIRDIELIKQITVKNYDSFLDHRTMVDGSVDPIFGRNLVSLKGQEWKDMRSSLSPAFTSSKIKLMVPLMVEVGNQMIESLKEEIKNSKDGKFIDVDAKDVTTRYANDVIASCAFGLKINSTTEKNNVFFKMAKEITTLRMSMILKIFLFIYLPRITKLFNIQFLPKYTSSFYRDIILNTMRDREAQNIIRPDMIHLLLEAKKGKLVHDEKTATDLDAGFATVEESAVGKTTVKKDWTDDDLVAQAVLFLLAGFDTVSTAMSFAIHELAVNPDVQAKLVAEIRENQEKNEGKLDYNSIQHMVYMDMVVSEVLRLWPPAAGLDRLCTKSVNLGRPNKDSTKDYYIRAGESVSIPIWPIHRDPKYYENPLKFDPERFSDEDKHKILPFTFIPFGMGPRNCIASRFGLCEVKVMLYQLLQHFEISPCEKTCIPVELSKESMNFQIKGGHWVRLRIRD